MQNTESPDAATLNGSSNVARVTLLSACASVAVSGGFERSVMKLELMDYENFHWNTFINRLSDRMVFPNCDGTLDNSRAALESFGNVDVDASIKFCQEHGGHCDCEVLMNTVSNNPHYNEGDES